MSLRRHSELQPIPPEPDILAIIHQTDAAARKAEICGLLRSAIASEYWKYLKAKNLKSVDPSIIRKRCIHFELVHPNPSYNKMLGYRLHFGLGVVIITPISLHPDPEIAPFLEPLNLSQVANEFFDPSKFVFRPRRQVVAPDQATGNIRPSTTNDGQTAVIALPEYQLLTVSRAPITTSLNEYLPYLRFGGQYLERFGFNIGEPVIVYLEKNKIILTVGTAQPAQSQTA